MLPIRIEHRLIVEILLRDEKSAHGVDPPIVVESLLGCILTGREQRNTHTIVSMTPLLAYLLATPMELMPNNGLSGRFSWRNA